MLIHRYLVILFVFTFVLTACSPQGQIPQPSAIPSTSTLEPTPTPTETATPIPTATATSTATPTATPVPTPIGGAPLTMALSTYPQLYNDEQTRAGTASIALYCFGESKPNVLYRFGREGLPDLTADQNDQRFHHVQISPDQKWLAFALTRDGSPQITVVDLATKQSAVVLNLPSPAFVDWLYWSPDGQWIGIVYYPNPSIPKWKTTVVSVDGKKRIDTNCSSIEGWDPSSNAFYCVKDNYVSVLYLIQPPQAAEKVVPWPYSRLYSLGRANFNFLRLFPEVDGVVMKDIDNNILYWGNNLHLLIGDSVTNQSVKEFLDGMVKIMEYSDDEVVVQAVELSPNGKKLMVRGADPQGFEKDIEIPVTFTHIYPIGSEPLTFSSQSFFNNLWGVAWSPDGDRILALTGLRNWWGRVPPVSWGVDMVIVDSETLETVWSVLTEPNGKMFLENMYTINSQLTNFDFDW